MESFANWLTNFMGTASAESTASTPEKVVPLAGAATTVPAEILEEAKKELQRMLSLPGMVEPERGNLDDPSIKWRQGKPNYTLANLAYLKGKTKCHAPGSLELLVENLVKTWEMEASHKIDTAQWTTVNHVKYHIQGNGGRKFDLAENFARGNYNVLMDAVDKSLYDAEKETFESSHHLFRNAFPQAFPWEVLEVFSGPPVVAFSWRHWGELTGEYNGKKGDGRLLNMVGVVVASVDEQLKITDLKIYYKPEEFLKGMTKATEVTTGCPFAKK